MYNKNKVLNNTSKMTKIKNITNTINNIKSISGNRKHQHKYEEFQNSKSLILIDIGSPIHITNKIEWLKNYHTIKNAPKYGGIDSNENLDIVGSGFLSIKKKK